MRWPVIRLGEAVVASQCPVVRVATSCGMVMEPDTSAVKADECPFARSKRRPEVWIRKLASR